MISHESLHASLLTLLLTTLTACGIASSEESSRSTGVGGVATGGGGTAGLADPGSGGNAPVGDACPPFEPPGVEQINDDTVQASTHRALVQSELSRISPQASCEITACGLNKGSVIGGAGDLPQNEAASACFCDAWTRCTPAHLRFVEGAAVGLCINDLIVVPIEGGCELVIYDSCELALPVGREVHPAPTCDRVNPTPRESFGPPIPYGIGSDSSCVENDSFKAAAADLATVADVEHCGCPSSRSPAESQLEDANCILNAATTCTPAIYQFTEIVEPEGRFGPSRTLTVVPRSDGSCELLGYSEREGMPAQSCDEFALTADGQAGGIGCSPR